MARRVVLGCGRVGRRIVSTLVEYDDSITVVDPDETIIEEFHETGIDGTVADPTNPSIIAEYGAGTESILVAGDAADTNITVTERILDVLDEPVIVAYTGQDPLPAERETLESLATRVVDSGVEFREEVFERLTAPVGPRLLDLKGVLREIEGTLGVFMHDNPDPDAIGAAIALCAVTDAIGLNAEACYFGEIAHQQNRALVNLLDLSLVNYSDPDEVSYDGIALVDHSRPGVNDQLLPETPIDIIIDHHPPRGPINGKYVDIRTDAGSTSTLLAEYLEGYGTEISTTVATALLYGIRVDTNDFEREVSHLDFSAASFLLPHADIGVLERVENPSVSASTLDTIARAILNRIQRDSVIASGVGRITDRDTLAQAAERLLSFEGVDTTVVFGYMDETVFVSARTRGTSIDIGEVLREAFDQIGSAGGHSDMAGAQLPLGILGEVESEDESLEQVVSEVILHRFFEVLGYPTAKVLPGNSGFETDLHE